MAEPRTYDPAEVRAALAGQTGLLRDAVRALCAAPGAERALAGPTRLGDWTVRELVAHLAIVLEWLPQHLDQPVPEGRPVSLVEWADGTRRLSATVDAVAREHAEGAFAGTSQEVASAFDRAADALLATLERPELDDPKRLFAMRFGPMPVSDFLVTRLVETVVHGDDLAAALGLDLPHERQAVAAVVRLLADAFAAQVPGSSVELRIPPYAVVQAVPGPRHTRGTPPNVVETDPLTWIRLATGRTDWASAVEAATVSASGERSGLAAYLPVLG